jgi:hypothetical protein
MRKLLNHRGEFVLPAEIKLKAEATVVIDMVEKTELALRKVQIVRWQKEDSSLNFIDDDGRGSHFWRFESAFNRNKLARNRRTDSTDNTDTWACSSLLI